MRVAIAALFVAALAGCSDGPYPEQEKAVRSLVPAYFAQLNADAGAKEQAARAARTDIDLPPTSLVLNTYDWDIAGSVFKNVVCTQCQAKLGTRVTVPQSPEIRCPACPAALATELNGQGRALPMFEIRSGTNTPVIVLVRYVRHSKVYDSNSAVAVTSKTEASNPIKPYTDAEQRGRGAYFASGLYRESGSALCTTAFVYKGGQLNQVDPESVKKMIQDPPENPTVSSMKLGRWGAVEEPLVPWLGKPPVAGGAKEAPKNP